MNFYYDPILGLQYDYLRDLFIIDLACLPQDNKFDTEQWMEYFRQTGVMLLESNSDFSIEVVGQITRYKL